MLSVEILGVTVDRQVLSGYYSRIVFEKHLKVNLMEATDG
jgi:hypothetical protein